jgi:hypothetical protein
VRNDDVLDEDYSEISEELAAITAHASEFAKLVKGKCTRPSSRRGQTQTTVLWAGWQIPKCTVQSIPDLYQD